MMDVDGDGLVSQDEYWGMIEMAGLEYDRATMDMAHSMTDMNGDGFIDMDEFMMMSGGGDGEESKEWEGDMEWEGSDMGPMPTMMYGAMNWGDMIWNECAMNQRIRIDGSCHTCKKPYVQSQDGRSCEFVGRREYVEEIEYEKYLGCYVDTEERTDYVNLGSDPSMTPALCIGLARNYGFKYVGVQNGNECWSPDVLPPQKVKESECDQECSGDSSVMCGGAQRVSVYEINYPEPLYTEYDG